MGFAPFVTVIQPQPDDAPWRPGDPVLHHLSIGSDPSTGDDDGRTPLHLAAAEGPRDTAAFLLSRGADPNCSDRWGATPLDDARRMGHGDLTSPRRYIARRVNPDHADDDGRTALHLAASEGQKPHRHLTIAWIRARSLACQGVVAPIG